MNDVMTRAPGRSIACLRPLLAGCVALVLSAMTGFSQPVQQQDGPSGGDADRLHAERLAQDASRAFDRFLAGELPSAVKPGDEKTADATTRDGSPRSIESGSDWLARTPRDYGALIERLSQPTVPNPVVDAARKFADERDAFLRGERRGTTLTQIAPEVPEGRTSSSEIGEERWLASGPSSDTSAPHEAADEGQAGLLGWLNHGYRAFQDDLIGKLGEATPPDAPSPKAKETIIAGEAAAPVSPGASPEASSPASQPTEPGASSGNATPQPEASQPDRALSPGEARREEMIRKAEIERKAAAAKAVEAAEADLLAKVRAAEAARKAEAERQAAEAARIAAEKEKAAEEARRAEAARKAEADRQAAEAARLAKEKAAAEAARKAEADRQAAEAARIAAEKAAEEARRAEVALKAEKERQAAEAARIAEAKAAEEARRLEMSRRPTVEPKVRRKVAKTRVRLSRRAAESVARAVPAPIGRPSPIERPGL